MFLNCIIIEDEPIAIDILTDYIAQVPFLKQVGSFQNAISAADYIRKNKVDVIFLDIHLPRLKGIDLIQTLPYPVKIIIVSAYPQYAIKSYEYSVTDYLLKPVELSRFLVACNKLLPGSGNNGNTSSELKNDDFIFVNVQKKKMKIYFNEILYIESQREYIKIYFTNKFITTKIPLTQFFKKLPPDDFIQIHRSFIVSKRKINTFTSTSVEIEGKTIPVGRNYKVSLKE